MLMVAVAGFEPATQVRWTGLDRALGWRRSATQGDGMIHILRVGRTLLIALALAIPAPATAEALPSLQTIGTPQEIALLTKALAHPLDSPEERNLALAQLDLALVQLPQGKARGVVQFFRAGLLNSLHRVREALLAADESVRLLPNYSGPLLMASEIYSFSDQAGPGADYLIRASRIDPELALRVTSYDIRNLLGRLRDERDEQREVELSTRLIEIDWNGDDFDTRSQLVLNVLKWRLASGDEKGARALVPSLIKPSHMYELLTLNSAKSVWENIDHWAGARLEKQWAIYLSETRERWAASKGIDSALEYADVLLLAGHHQTVIAEMLPMVSARLDSEQDKPIMFMASKVADSLSRYGRWDEIEAMFESLMKIWPMGTTPVALNLSANRARHLRYAGRNDEALKLIDATIADANRWGSEVNGSALRSMHHVRTCILHEMGRDAEVGISASFARLQASPADVASHYLCVDRPEEARQVLIQGLKDKRTRDRVIAFVQPVAHRPAKSPLGDKIAARFLKLRQDPKLRAAVEKHGRILPFVISDLAPLEVQRSAP